MAIEDSRQKQRERIQQHRLRQLQKVRRTTLYERFQIACSLRTRPLAGWLRWATLRVAPYSVVATMRRKSDYFLPTPFPMKRCRTDLLPTFKSISVRLEMLRRRNQRLNKRRRRITAREVDVVSHLYVPFNGHGDDRRFLDVVRMWWHKMPNEIKDVLVSYWTQENGRRCRYPWGPIGGLLRYWKGKTSTTAATFQFVRDPDSFYVAFCSHYFDYTPDDMAIVVLAHEFAHVYQMATGTKDTFVPLSHEQVIAAFEADFGITYENALRDMPPDTLLSYLEQTEYSHSPIEVDAERLVREWRFDMDSLKQWEARTLPTIPTSPNNRYQ